MKLKGYIAEDHVNYKKWSTILEMPYCDYKCNKECGYEVCQNTGLKKIPEFDLNIETIMQYYKKNPITEAIIFQGLEPFDSWSEMLEMITIFRKYCADDIVIYTGYNKEEIQDKIDILKSFTNIIIKFGRFIPNQEPHYDEILGVNLASNNQYGEKIS